MSTRSVTIVLTKDLKPIVTMYRHNKSNPMDGEPRWQGRELLDFFEHCELGGGLGKKTMGTYANGMPDLAAQLVAHFKTEVGGIYLIEAGEDADQSYTYTLYPVKDTDQDFLWLSVVEHYPDKTLYNGPISEARSAGIFDLEK